MAVQSPTRKDVEDHSASEQVRVGARTVQQRETPRQSPRGGSIPGVNQGGRADQSEVGEAVALNGQQAGGAVEGLRFSSMTWGCGAKRDVSWVTFGNSTGYGLSGAEVQVVYQQESSPGLSVPGTDSSPSYNRLKGASLHQQVGTAGFHSFLFNSCFHYGCNMLI